MVSSSWSFCHFQGLIVWQGNHSWQQGIWLWLFDCKQWFAIPQFGEHYKACCGETQEHLDYTVEMVDLMACNVFARLSSKRCMTTCNVCGKYEGKSSTLCTWFDACFARKISWSSSYRNHWYSRTLGIIISIPFAYYTAWFNCCNPIMCLNGLD